MLQTGSGVPKDYLQDGRDSTRALTNGSGVITDTYSCTAFGELLNQTGTAVNPYLYTGQQFDSLTGLYDLRARYYNPALGRFLSQDIYPYNFSNPVELNRYIYTANDPINLVDPSGHTALTEGGLLQFFSRQNTPKLIAVGFGTAAAIYAVYRLVETQDSTMTWQRILALEERQSQLAPDENQNPTPFPPSWPDYRTPIPTPGQPKETPRAKMILYHYGKRDKIAYITVYNVIPFSDATENPKRARYGSGVYFTDIAPGSMSMAQIATALYGAPFINFQLGVEAWVAVDVGGLKITNPRNHVYLVPTNSDLDVTGRIDGYGLTPDDNP